MARKGEESRAETLFVLREEKQKTPKPSEDSGETIRGGETRRASEVCPLKKAVLRVSVHSLARFRRSGSPARRVAAWKRSSFLSFAASFLSLFWFPSLRHLRNLCRCFWPRYVEMMTLPSWHFLLESEFLGRVHGWGCEATLHILRQKNKSAQRGYRARSWAQSGRGRGEVWSKGEMLGFRRDRRFLSVHLPPPGLKSWVASFQMSPWGGGWCIIAKRWTPQTHRNESGGMLQRAFVFESLNLPLESSFVSRRKCVFRLCLCFVNDWVFQWSFSHIQSWTIPVINELDHLCPKQMLWEFHSFPCH